MSPPDDALTLSGRQPRAIQSSLRVLEAVATHGAGVTAKQIARLLDMPPATVYRIVNILVAEQYLVRLPGLAGFALGSRFNAFIDVAGKPRVVQAARDLLAELRLTLRVGVHLCSCRPDAVGFLDVDPDFPPPATEIDLNSRLRRSAIGALLSPESPSLQRRSDDPSPGYHSVAIAIRDDLADVHACLWLVGTAAQIERLADHLPATAERAQALDRLLR